MNMYADKYYLDINILAGQVILEWSQPVDISGTCGKLGVIKSCIGMRYVHVEQYQNYTARRITADRSMCACVSVCMYIQCILLMTNFSTLKVQSGICTAKMPHIWCNIDIAPDIQCNIQSVCSLPTSPQLMSVSPTLASL